MIFFMNKFLFAAMKFHFLLLQHELNLQLVRFTTKTERLPLALQIIFLPFVLFEHLL